MGSIKKLQLVDEINLYRKGKELDTLEEYEIYKHFLRKRIQHFLITVFTLDLDTVGTQLNFKFKNFHLKLFTFSSSLLFTFPIFTLRCRPLFYCCEVF